MGKSYRKTKIFGCAGGSDKKDKRLCNRALRKKVREQLKQEDYDKPFPIKQEIIDEYSMTNDGKHYWKDAKDEDMRK